jgi:hypothetical protein
MRKFLLVMPAILLVTAACSGGGDSDKAAVQIGDAELQAMAEVFTNATFGDAYANMVLDETSGMETKEAFIEDDNDPEGEAKDAEEFGYVSSYERAYFDEEGLTDGGPVAMSVGVTLFDTEAGATGYMRDDLEEGRKSFSGTTELGTLLSFETFNANAGKENWGVFLRLQADEETFGTDSELSMTVITFQRGRVLGNVFVMRGDSKDAKADTMRVAKLLDQRMQAILRGEKPAAPEAASGR